MAMLRPSQLPRLLLLFVLGSTYRPHPYAALHYLLLPLITIHPNDPLLPALFLTINQPWRLQLPSPLRQQQTIWTPSSVHA